MNERQESLDAFYFRNGPCCAGCDHWRSLNSVAGECTRSAPMDGEQRVAMLGIVGGSLDAGAGHAITPRGHHCGEFKDEFDWTSLPLAYRHRVGAPTP
jgi:hypothetical protein